MPGFVASWLSIWVCTCGAVIYQALGRSNGFSSLTILLAIEIVALIAWALYWMLFYPAYFTPFRHLPTPPGRTLLRGNRKEVFPDYAWPEIRAAYETIPSRGLVRFYEPLSTEVLVATNTEAVKEMFTLKSDHFGHPKNVQYLINRLTGSKFNFLSSHGHKLFRKHLRPAFTPGHVRRIMPAIWGKSDKMITLIERGLENDQEPKHIVDLRDYIRRTMWDIFGLAVLGHDCRTLENPTAGARDRLSGILGRLNSPAIKWGNFIMNYLDVRPLLAVLSPILERSQAGKALEQIRSTVRHAALEKQAKCGPPTPSDCVAKDLGLDITGISIASGIFPTEELVDNGMLFLTAGPNSTGTAVEWAIYELARRPTMQDRLRREVSNCLPLSATSSVELVQHLQALPYLSAIVNEVIRYYPFVPLSSRVAEKDTTLLGEHIPKGTIMLIPVEAFNRDVRLWGADSDQFNPDRWLGDGEGSGGATNAYAMLSFGAGPGTCIGQSYARAMIACLVAALVRRFEIELANLETAGRVRPAPFMKSEEGMMARLRVVREQ
ncbi:cytochrome P450 [Parathielavia appendiculata]|uniref:Cytochrome P450 n=1 Tax=Parathielavia appendiculata TaxID=2587402 RepID=A0AAN6TRQ2_9PEZI|nr:cytochrome P450 [Parathielavia appendiculata]